MNACLVLEPVLGLNAAAPLRIALLERRGQAVTVDASGVQRLGGLCLQVLLSAARTWLDDGQPFDVAPRSDAFEEALTTFGANARFDDPMLEAA